MHRDVLGSAANSNSGILIQRGDGEEWNLLLMHHIQERIRVGIGNAGEIIAPRRGQTAAEFNVPYPARLLSNSDKLDAAAQTHHNHHALLRVILGGAILIDATHPHAADRLLSKGRTQLGQRVEG